MQPTTTACPQKPPPFIWLLPLVMLFAAALACDDYYVSPATVGRVEADASAAGRVYAEVVNIGLSYADSSNKPGEKATYLSDDYGVNWRASEHVFAESDSGRVPVEVYGESVVVNDGSTWWFPRSIFRGIFYDGGSYPSEKRFELPQGIVSGSRQGDMLYVPLGTEGVLALKASSDYRDWTLSAKGIDTLSPLPLTITKTSDIVGFIVLALFIPPFALIHAYLLSRVWVYLLPAVEARQVALKTTAGLVLLAIGGIIFWLTNARTDLYEVIAILTGITVIVGVSLTVYMAMQQQVSDYTRNRLAVGALVLSLVVPGGVAAIFAMWWLVFGLVFAYWAYQRVYQQYRGNGEPTAEGRVQRWKTDRLALETMTLVLLLILGLYAAGFIVQFLVYSVGGAGVPRSLVDLMWLAGLPVSLFVIYKALQINARWRAGWVIKPKPDLNAQAYIQLESRTLVRRLAVHTVLWVVLALIASGATFMGQAWAYGWFTTLLKGR